MSASHQFPLTIISPSLLIFEAKERLPGQRYPSDHSLHPLLAFTPSRVASPTGACRDWNTMHTQRLVNPHRVPLMPNHRLFHASQRSSPRPPSSLGLITFNGA